MAFPRVLVREAYKLWGAGKEGPQTAITKEAVTDGKRIQERETS